jgi:hypothetical protein
VRRADVAETVRQQRHGAAAFDGGELFLVAGEDQLAPVPGGVLDERGEVSNGDHGAFVSDDQRAGRDASALDGSEQPGGVGGDLDSSGVELIGGVLGGGGAEYRPVPGPGDSGEDSGFAGAGRASNHFHDARRGKRVPDGSGLVQPQPARRGVLARARLERGGVGDVQ